jgi:hypothetical protein
MEGPEANDDGIENMAPRRWDMLSGLFRQNTNTVWPKVESRETEKLLLQLTVIMVCLTFQSLAVTLHTTRFNIKKF